MARVVVTAAKFAIRHAISYDPAPLWVENTPTPNMNRLLVPLALVTLVLASTAACADSGMPEAEARGTFVAALRAYDTGEFERAVDLLERAVQSAPACARCAHLLGKSYGRMAEQAGWMDAITLARKTRDALEQAVGIAPNDVEAIEDLIRYYRAAPGFLGGSNEKAEALERRLREGAGDRTG